MHFVNLNFQSHKVLADFLLCFPPGGQEGTILDIYWVQMAKNWSSAVPAQKKKKKRRQGNEWTRPHNGLDWHAFLQHGKWIFYCFSSMRNSLKDREGRNRGFSLTTIIKLNLIKPFYYFLLKANIFSIFLHA